MRRPKRVHEKLVNIRFVYVSISRARYEENFYPNDSRALGVELSREASKHTAIEHQTEQGYSQSPQNKPAKEQSQRLALAL